MAFALIILLALPLLVLAEGPTKVFIDEVPEYALMSTCAEEQVSTIVRDMAYVCGDGSKMTSYVCFCWQSSAKASSLIDKYVMSACTAHPEQNTTALDVFSKYCELAEPAIASSTAASTTQSSASTFTTSASPASVSTSSPPAQTQTSPPTPQSSSNNSRTVAIACGVTIPITVLAIAGVAFLLYGKRKKTLGTKDNPVELSQDEVNAQPHEADTQAKVYELKSGYHAVEIGGSAMPNELAGDNPKEKSLSELSR